MRKLLLATAALAGIASVLPTAAKAEGTTVSLGGRLFDSVFFQSASNQNTADSKVRTYSLQSYFRLYATANYAAANGINYGFKSEIRGGGNGGALFFDRAWGYVKSDKFGEFRFGGMPGVIGTVAVANDETAGTGGWDGEYGFKSNNPNFRGPGGYLVDAGVDGLNGIQYYSPKFAGIGFGIGWIPSTENQIGGSPIVETPQTAILDRVEVALTYAGSFGSTGVNADIGYVTGKAPKGFQNLSFVDAGLEVTLAGFSVGGHLDTGKFNGNGPGGYGAVANGLGSTTAYDIGVIYGIGAFSVGAQYDGHKYATTATTDSKFSGEAAGATYKLVPGVTGFLDVLVGERTDTGLKKVNFTGVGVGTYFQW